MKSAPKILFVASLALAAFATFTPARATVVTYEYPQEYEIQSRQIGTWHRLNTCQPPMAAAVPEERKLDVVVYFAPASDKLSTQANAEISKAAAIIKSSKDVVHVLVEGHTDSSGKATKNQELSYRRAVQVVHALVKDDGISPQVALAKGFGSVKPVATNSTATGRAANRRVEFVLINQ